MKNGLCLYQHQVPKVSYGLVLGKVTYMLVSIRNTICKSCDLSYFHGLLSSRLLYRYISNLMSELQAERMVIYHVSFVFRLVQTQKGTYRHISY